MPTAKPDAFDPTFGLDRDTLRSELIALYHQYRTDAEQAATLHAKYETLMTNILALLDEEFPGWSTPQEPDKPARSARS